MLSRRADLARAAGAEGRLACVTGGSPRREITVTPVGDTPIPDTVDALLASAQQIYDDERSQGEALDARLNQMTAFSGLLLTLIAPLGANQLDSHGTALDVAYVVSVILFAATALWAMSAGFRSRRIRVADATLTTGWVRTGIRQVELNEYSGERTALDPIDAKRQIIADLVAGAEDLIALNGLKLGLIRQVAVGLSLALLAIAAQAIILVT